MSRWSNNFNHLAYAYNTIIFTFVGKNSLVLIMSTLEQYEKVSRQLINKDKKCVLYVQKCTCNPISGSSTTHHLFERFFPI